MPAPRSDAFRLDGKVAFVTGGTKNIGRATARTFAKAGADLVITARTASDLDEAQADLKALGGGRVLAVTADVSNDEDIVRSVGAAVDTFGGVDILVNNAFVSTAARGLRAALETSADDWNAIWRGNVLAPYRYIQLLEPTMRNRGSGSIINLVSIAMHGYVKGLLTYATTKSALATMTRHLAAELGPAVRVNAIAPGAIPRDEQSTMDMQRQITELAPMQRVGTADEIASVALFLA